MYNFRGRMPSLLSDDRLGAETLPAFRDGEALYVDGKIVHRNPVKFSVHGAVQPLSGTDLLIVPEGDRQTEQYLVWQPLRDGVTPLQVEDKVVREGATFQVQMVKLWGSAEASSGFVQARIMRIDVGADSLGPADENTTVQ